MALNWLIAVAAVDIVGNGFQKGYIIVENGFFGAQKMSRGGWTVGFCRKIFCGRSECLIFSLFAVLGI